MTNTGISDEGLADLLQLIAFEKKRDVQTFAKTLTIRFEDFAGLALALEDGLLGYYHRMRRRELPPPKHLVSPEKLAGFSSDASPDELRASARRVSQFFKERKVWYGHMFSNADLSVWHFFYFSEQDTQPISHWKATDGHPHMHFVNHLWPKHSAQSVWEAFNTEPSFTFGAVHIRFQQLEQERLV